MRNTFSKAALAAFIGISLATAATAYAYDGATNYANCYLFSKNKLVNKGKCLVSTSGGAGGYTTVITYNKKTYSREYSTMDEKSMKYSERFDYYRHPKTLKKTKTYRGDDMLLCSLYGKKKVDLCWQSIETLYEGGATLSTPDFSHLLEQ